MAAQHTPEPWLAAGQHFAICSGARTYWPVLRPGNDPVAICHVLISTDGHGREEGEANARLIAAAPDLLVALQEWIGLHERGHLPRNIGVDHCIELARAAVARAGQ